MRKIAIGLLVTLIGTVWLGLYFLTQANVIVGVVLAGAAGSVLSVLSKLPSITVSGEQSVYLMRVVSRIGTGLASSIIGAGLLAAGAINIILPGIGSVSQLLDGCKGSLTASGKCGTIGVLVLAALTMLFGFSERALASFEGSVFSKGQRSETSG